jgi:hypothetical protein
VQQGEPDPLRAITRVHLGRLSLRYVNRALTLGSDGLPVPCVDHLVDLSPEAAFGSQVPGPWRGIVWPFRDATENPPPHFPATSAETFTCESENGVFAFLNIDGGTNVGQNGPGPFVPTDVALLDRGIPGNGAGMPITPFVFAVRRDDDNRLQQLLRVEVEGGDADVVTQNRITGVYQLQTMVPVEPSVHLHVIPWPGQPADGHMVNGLASLVEGEYHPFPVATQNNQTSAGDNTREVLDTANGSELDAMYAKVTCEDREFPPGTCTPVLRLFLAGNLQSDGANVEIFIDFDPADGQHVLRGDNSMIANNALNRMGAKTAMNGNSADGPLGAGLTFESGCAPDFYLSGNIIRDGQGALLLQTYAAELPMSGQGRGWFLGSVDFSAGFAGDATPMNGDAGAPAIRSAWVNANNMGVGAGTGPAPASGPGSGADVVSGLEFEIPLSAIGGEGRNYRIVAFITSPDHGFVYNQVLPGLGGRDSLGEPRNVDLSRTPGVQCATVYAPKQPLWKNGDFDRRSAQTSQVGLDQDWNRFARITADDFYLCEGQIHAIDTITGKLITDAAVPKAVVALFEDCDGRPDLSRPIAVLSAAPQVFEGFDIPAVDGDLLIHDTGETFDGLSILSIEARFAKPVFLRGGTYWVSIIGFSGTGDPTEQFFWGTADNLNVKGRPGQFFDSDTRTWVDIDTLCCGCTDFNFCIGGQSCKLLFDNAAPRLPDGGGIWATRSLQNGSRTSDKSRSASDFVVPPCDGVEICYVEGYVWTNCDRVAMEFYGNECDQPASQGEIAGPYLADCLIDTGVRAPAPGNSSIELKLLKALFFTFPPLFPRPGTNVWVSLYALGDNAQNSRGYLALGDRCDHDCHRLFNPPLVRGPAFDTSRWLPASAEFSLHDHAIAVAVRADLPQPAPTVEADCPADVNRSGAVTVQDIFDFLAAWFAGCP